MDLWLGTASWSAASWEGVFYPVGAPPGVETFLERLASFLDRLPPEPRFALEVRNRTWLTRPFLELLRRYRVALALIDHPWMPTAAHYRSRPELLTTDFTYIRWLG